MSGTVDLYDNVYGDFASQAERAVRTETWGEDLGQSSWLTADEWLGFAAQLGIGAGTRVLEVGSGSGGPALHLAEKLRCRIVGVDVNAHGVENARALAAARGLTELARFEAIDAGKPLPFPDQSFDAVVSNDAMCHIPNRGDVLKDWFRVLRPGGRALFSDALVVTGAISNKEIEIRTSIGFFLLVPPGANETLLEAAGFGGIVATDVTENAAVVAGRWHDARARHRDALVGREGEDNFAGLQRFLACVRDVSRERRLSRFAYLAERPVS